MNIYIIINGDGKIITAGDSITELKKIMVKYVIEDGQTYGYAYYYVLNLLESEAEGDEFINAINNEIGIDFKITVVKNNTRAEA